MVLTAFVELNGATNKPNNLVRDRKFIQDLSFQLVIDLYFNGEIELDVLPNSVSPQ
ncbi:hypothetical protein GL2_26990 [Microbulbifer sp. GL-2]|nr:hypothetical protein GL2_26990 [Microbulbifer sp. GL-2]